MEATHPYSGEDTDELTFEAGEIINVIQFPDPEDQVSWLLFFFLLFKKNSYAPVSQANWCNITFTAGNLFPSHSSYDLSRVKPPPLFVPGSPAWEVDDLPTELSLPLQF